MIENNNIFPPSTTCILCDKTLEEVGGSRIIGQQIRGVSLSDVYRGGGNKDYPHQSVKLSDSSDKYVVVWSEKSKWTEANIEKARQEFLNGRHPWLCQICGERKCSTCGSPINYPVGSGILYDNGCSGHCAMLPIDPGCCNPQCKEYKKWDDESKDE